ncbi:MAG TPA: tRNA lysidine(34) synthetase TilS, partial [Terriglobales bacterium]|nr:tRNA lysidine(34) synthetase TilS [Terriglobales bacterium]
MKPVVASAMLSDSFLAYARRHELLHAGDRVGVAVSGGRDSVALLRLLLEARGALGVVLSVIHFNHKLRGREAYEDERFVAALAGQHGLAFHSRSADTQDYARKNHLSLEAAGRSLRQRFFGQQLSTNKVDMIATAHTMDDQAETVLLRMLRGAGTRGLAGIFPQLRIAHGQAIVRPLLGMRRRQLAEYLEQIGQAWREDASNQDLRFLRNRVRHRLLPILEREFQPGIIETLAQLAELAREEERFWEQELDSARRQAGLRRAAAAGRVAGHGRSTDAVVLRAEKLGRFPLALERRLIRSAAAELGLKLEFQHVQ